jgi:hypothetical protein
LEDPNGAEGSQYGGRSPRFFDEEVVQEVGAATAASDAMLMGRVL